MLLLVDFVLVVRVCSVAFFSVAFGSVATSHADVVSFDLAAGNVRSPPRSIGISSDYVLQYCCTMVIVLLQCTLTI